MQINNFNITFFNMYNYINKPKPKLPTNTLLENAIKNINTSSLSKNIINATGTYNNMGRISTLISPTRDVWTSNGEKLANNNSSTSLKDMLTNIPENLIYKGKLTSTEIAEKYITTGELTAQEDHYLYTVNPTLASEAHMKAQVPLVGKEIDKALKANNITLDSDEELKITISNSNKITVSGINDPEKEQKIQEYLQSYSILSSVSQSLASRLNGATFCASQNINNLSSEVRGLINATHTANDFLYNMTSGSISLEDLTIKDNKIEGLPRHLDTLLNGNIDKNANINGIYVIGYKSCIIKAKAYEEKYGKEKLPILTSNFTYKNGELTIIEDPELPINAANFKNYSSI